MVITCCNATNSTVLNLLPRLWTCPPRRGPPSSLHRWDHTVPQQGKASGTLRTSLGRRLAHSPSTSSKRKPLKQNAKFWKCVFDQNNVYVEWCKCGDECCTAFNCSLQIYFLISIFAASSHIHADVIVLDMSERRLICMEQHLGGDGEGISWQWQHAAKSSHIQSPGGRLLGDDFHVCSGQTRRLPTKVVRVRIGLEL